MCFIISKRMKKKNKYHHVENVHFASYLLINDCKIVENKNKYTKVLIRKGGDCQCKDVIYWARCTKHIDVYISKIIKTLSKRIWKYKYGILKRSNNNELLEYFSEEHDFFLKKKTCNSGKTLEELYFKKDFWICRIQSLEPDDLNVDHSQYASQTF